MSVRLIVLYLLFFVFLAENSKLHAYVNYNYNVFYYVKAIKIGKNVDNDLY